MKKKQVVSMVVAGMATVVGVLAVLDPIVPDAWKGAVTAFVAVLNYLVLSPVAKLLGATEAQE